MPGAGEVGWRGQNPEGTVRSPEWLRGRRCAGDRLGPGWTCLTGVEDGIQWEKSVGARKARDPAKGAGA